MKKLIVISAFILFALSPPAISKQITSHLKMVDGYFNGILTAHDDEPIWFGILEFDFLGSQHLTCRMDSMHTSGDAPDRMSSVNYRCQNGFSVQLSKNENDRYAILNLQNINFESGEESQLGSYKVTSSIPLTMIENNKYNDDLFNKRNAEREQWVKENTVDVFSACDIIMSSHLLAYQMVNAGTQNNSAGRNEIRDALSKLYPKNADEMVQSFIIFHSGDKEPFGMPLTFGVKGRMIKMCMDQPGDYIPEFGSLVISGKIFR